jgi:hypothetical protein
MSQKLRANICEFTSPAIGVDDLDPYQLEQSIPTELEYACRHWVHHLQWAKISFQANRQMQSQVLEFLQRHLVHWLEVLGLLGKPYEAVRAIVSLEEMVEVGSQPSSMPA